MQGARASKRGAEKLADEETVAKRPAWAAGQLKVS